MPNQDLDALTREELKAEVLRLQALQEQNSPTAFGRPIQSTPVGHDELLSAIEKTRMPMILTDPRQPDDPIIFANRAFQQLSGYSSEELLGRNCRFLQGPDTNPADVRAIRDALKAKRDLAIDILNYRKDGSPFLNELYISPVCDADGELLYHFGSQVDVTGYRKDRRTLEESERRKRSVFDSVLDFAIVVTDRDGIVTDWNSGAAHVMGWTAEEMCGQDASRFFTPEDNANGRPAYEMTTALREGRAPDERWHVRKGDERFWASGEMMPLRDETDAHIGFVKIMRDRTAEHLAGEALQREERHRQALLELSNQLTEHDGDAASLADIATSLLGRTLGVQLVGYGLVDPEAETITVERDWTSGGAHPIAGTHRFRDFGTYIEDIKRRETVVVTDARLDPRTSAYAEALEAISARALVNTPVFEHGRFVSLLFVCSAEPREWLEDELIFIREVATRTRAAIARRQAETALRASEEELRLVADALPVLVAFIDRTLTYRFANAAYKTWFGQDPETVMGRTVVDLVGEDGLAARRAGIGRALAGETVQMDLDWPWWDGRRRIADIRYTPRRDASGAVDGFYVFVQDVTAQRDAAALLAERADTLEREVAERTVDRNALWMLSSDIMLRCTFEGVMTAVNPAWTAVLGWREDELLGRTIFEFIHPDDVAHTIEGAKASSEGHAYSRFENRYRCKDGSYRWITWSTSPAEGMINAVGRDFTADKNQADALAQTEDALRQSQKMEAVGQLTGGVAHDFNNLLTIIRSSVDFLRRPDLPEERRRRYMDAVSETVDRAAKLTGQLLAFARRQALKPETLNVGERLRAIGDMLDTVTGARVRVAIDLPGTPCFIKADLSQFETALVNMAVNARDAMEGEGTLTMRLSCGGSMPPIRGHGGGPGPFAKIELRDTGSGIAEADLARIFEPFFTTKEVGKGTGLGLSQVFGFAKQSGGDVDVHSVVGEGTTFTLYLPEVEPKAPPASNDDASGPVPGGVGLKVLVVEDNIEVGKFATQILEDLGYRPEWVANAEIALDRLGAEGDGFDAVFSDVVMPGMGGIALAQELRRRLPRLPVVLASGYSHVLAENGDHGFELLHKPYSADQLSRVLRRVNHARRGR
ncbi:PAS domain S-box protein [Methylobacterium sp. 17Sr1-1]|uniref:PAS domain S-box protein n=1 Tax=Methylobacterium sp. 17Sr1-1 TaxID=2202826 RepID=UPI000D6FF572|nr:PAS domain S-box protein [Methylobacterium sp. 17Sr1-1]AWN51075.1 hybrid sensor histidine kinase/response regulator [Methylobacterium sp. 17Sr1-1]